MLFSAECAFKKWSIGVDTEQGCIVIRFDHFPNHGEIRLYDFVGDDLAHLAEVFNNADQLYKLAAKQEV